MRHNYAVYFDHPQLQRRIRNTHELSELNEYQFNAAKHVAKILSLPCSHIVLLFLELSCFLKFRRDYP